MSRVTSCTRLVEDQTRCCILDHLPGFYCACHEGLIVADVAHTAAEEVGHRWVFQFIPEVSMGWGSGLCADRSRSSTPNWEKHIFPELERDKDKLLSWSRNSTVAPNITECCGNKISLHWN